ncbi:hypothetical protein NBRC116596_31310 [Litorivita sp. NS0012-18]
MVMATREGAVVTSEAATSSGFVAGLCTHEASAKPSTPTINAPEKRQNSLLRNISNTCSNSIILTGS